MFLRKFWDSIKNKRIEKKYVKQRTPFCLSDNTWVVATDWGVEIGDVQYIVTEFINSSLKDSHKKSVGLVYHYKNEQSDKFSDHEHRFEDVLIALLDSPRDFSIKDFYSDYSKQEIELLESLQQKLID